MVSSALWVGGLFLADRDLVRPEVTPIAVAIVFYLVVAVALITVLHEHLPVTLGALWLFAVCLTIAVLATTSGPDGWVSIPAGIFFGSLAFIAWAATGGLLWAFTRNATSS
ncbi:MAG: hypothetical protein ABIR57_07165 [Aeromicrobium sp.]